MTTCPSCGATVAADTSDSSPYESYAETVPYIPYDAPTINRGAAEQTAPAPREDENPPSPASSETQAPEGSSPIDRESHDPGPLADETITQEATLASSPVAGSRGERLNGEDAEDFSHEEIDTRPASYPTINQESTESYPETQNQEVVSGAISSESPAHEVEQPQTTSVAPRFIEGEAGLQPAPGTGVMNHVPTRSHRGSAASVIALFVILVLLVVGSGGGLTYYLTTFHPAELRAQATADAQNVLAQATAQANAINPQLLYAQVVSSRPSISDPLNDPNTSIWQATPSCTLTNGAYHSSVTTKSEIVFCRALLTDYHDVAFQVQMATLKGDLGGLMFRSSVDAASNIQSYFFGLDSNGGYHLFTIQGGSLNLLGNGTSPAATKGLNKPNLITVIARGTRFYLYVNKQFATSINDNTYVSGSVGLFALDLQNPTDIEFNNAQVWHCERRNRL